MAEAVLVGERCSATKALEVVDTPNQKTIADVSQLLKSDPAHSVKALLVQGIPAEQGEATPVVALFLRGDHELNEIKADSIAHRITINFCNRRTTCCTGFNRWFRLDHKA